MTIVTRFAPSPTGYLHIGGARTALFNWLFARHHGGRYLLRIEDTDRARSTEAAIGAIMDGLDWLGLDHDGQTIFQFARAARHRDVAEAMVERGAAFRCYQTPEELEARRQRRDALHVQRDAVEKKIKAAEKDGGATGDLVREFESLNQELNAAYEALKRSPYRDGLKPPSPDAPYVIRLRAPDGGEIINDDLVQGRVAIRASELDDLILLRADATPTYMLAVVVDDHDMSVTHVIRGDDHLSNAARQIPIYDAMGWDKPAFAHVPMIHGPDGQKLSKRHGAQAVHEYRDLGYLPEAMTNYLARLGWSMGDREIFSMDEAIAAFDLAHVHKAPARLDFAKLNAVNGHYIREADDARLAALTFTHLEKQGPLAPAMRAKIEAAIPVLKTRAKTIPELADQARYLMLSRPLNIDAAARKAMKDEAMKVIAALRPHLAALARWDAETIGAALKAFAAEAGVGMGMIGPALRAVLTGGTPAPDLAFVLATLGREETLGRIDDHM